MFSQPTWTLCFWCEEVERGTHSSEISLQAIEIEADHIKDDLVGFWFMIIKKVFRFQRTY